MAKGRKTTVTDMQMNILNGFDRELRNAERSGAAAARGFTPTSGLLRNAPVDKWKSADGLKKVSAADKRIADIKAELARMERKGF
jgi:hypothetical protein